jgi:hypothetical protein
VNNNMELDSSFLTADVYHLEDIGGVHGVWLWDFGVFTLFGSEEYPYRQPNNMEMFSATVSGIDVEEVADEEPEKTVEVEVYEGDYVVYIETDFGKNSFALSPSDEPYHVVESDASMDGDDVVVLKENKSHGRKETIVVDESVYQSDWTPVEKF